MIWSWSDQQLPALWVLNNALDTSLHFFNRALFTTFHCFARAFSPPRLLQATMFAMTLAAPTRGFMAARPAMLINRKAYRVAHVARAGVSWWQGWWQQPAMVPSELCQKNTRCTTALPQLDVC